MSNTPQTPDAQLKKLKRDNQCITITLIATFIGFLYLLRVLIIPNTFAAEDATGRINQNDPYVKQVATNVSEYCDRIYGEFKNSRMTTRCMYYAANTYVYEHVNYSHNKSDSTKNDMLRRFMDYEIKNDLDARYNEHVLTGKTDAVCTDMAIVECSILRHLNQTCDLATRIILEDNKVNGHMFIKGMVGNETIYCDPTAGYCYGEDE